MIASSAVYLYIHPWPVHLKPCTPIYRLLVVYRCTWYLVPGPNRIRSLCPNPARNQRGWDRHVYRQTGTQTDGRANRQIDRPTSRHKERDADKHTQRHPNTQTQTTHIRMHVHKHKVTRTYTKSQTQAHIYIHTLRE